MDQRTEPIKQDIDHIRDQMTDKIAAIEDKVKGQVNDTVEAVKQTFDIKQQVGDHPWAALGVSLLAGYVLGTLGDSDDSPETRYRADYSRHEQPRPQFASSDHDKDKGYTSGGYNASSYSSHAASGYASSPAQSSPAAYGSQASYAPQGGYSYPRHEEKGGFLNDLMGQFGGELDTIKTAAISSLVAMLRDSIKDVLPQFNSEYERVRQQHDDTPNGDSDATLNTLLRQPVSNTAPTSGSRDFSNTASTMGSAVGSQDRDLNTRSVGDRTFGATETMS